MLLAEYGLGAVALYYLAPALLGGFVGSLRGFAGEVTAAQALDLLASDGSAVLIDIRTEVRAACACSWFQTALAMAAQWSWGMRWFRSSLFIRFLSPVCCAVLPGCCVVLPG